MDVVAYDPEWLPRLAALARAHARLAPPGLGLSDADVARGLARHAYWPFYTPGLAGGQTLLAVEGTELLAAAQVGFVGHGWGYGAAPGDGPEWLHEAHCSLFWLLAWPGIPAAAAAAAALCATVVGWARGDGLPGLEAFRGGPGFLLFGTQLSSHWPHLWGPLRAAGFRQPRDLLVYCGETDPAALPVLRDPPGRLEFRSRRGRLEAWLDGHPVGAAAARPIRETPGADRAGPAEVDPRAAQWAVVRRLYVDASARGAGVGSALLAEQLGRLHAAGTTRYLLHIPDDPAEFPAHALYRKFGRLADRQQVLRVSF